MAPVLMRKNSKGLLQGIAGMILLSSPTAWAELVYDNSREYSTNFVVYSVEYGDEITLAGSARTVTSFQFEYFGDFGPQSVARVQLRFYANDGPGRYPTPGTLLYQSEPLVMSRGLNGLLVSGLSVAVPSDFTWTVRFSGLTMQVGDQAGLVLYGKPRIGNSYKDYWQKNERGWELYIFGDNTIGNFAARVYATDPLVSFLGSTRLPDGLFQTSLSGPIGGLFEVQVSSDLRQWTHLTWISFLVSPLDFVDSWAATLDRRFYRLVSQSPRPP